jgi:serine/threonine protein kinase/Tfp pilus assembly protein PilF
VSPDPPDDLATAPSAGPPPDRTQVSGPVSERTHPSGPPPEAGPAVPPIPTAARYDLQAEIARGGMGEVYAARDTVLGRGVAVKTLQARFAGHPRLAHRFLEEAKITGQLQHPGVPPVHDLGTLADGRPFLAMKLVKGHTLADLLKDRPSPAADLPRFVCVFEQVCQTVGFAHGRGVIHRDLKPANVMVGAHGEVQVMDWGVAKVLGDDRPEPPGEPEPDAPPMSIIDTGRTPADATEAGSVVGTPAFMPPEQARGELARVDARADVFALGGILCQILTGLPAYAGGRAVVRAQSELGIVDDAFARLDGCGARPELIALAKACLAKEPADRPATGQAVADAVGAFRAGVEGRLRAAETERAAAEARTVEQRKRRRVQLALLAAVGLLLLGGGAAAWWQDRQAAERRTEQADRERDEQQRHARNAQAVGALLDRCDEDLRADRVAAAALALEQAEARADGGSDDVRLARCRTDLELLRALDRLDDLRWTPTSGTRLGKEKVAQEWPVVFRGYGLVPGQGPPAAAAARLAASPVRDRALAALDRWLVTDRSAALAAVLHAADPDPFRDAVREAVRAADDGRVTELAAAPEALEQPPRFAVVLGEWKAVPVPRREAVLQTALRRRPDSLHLLMALGDLYRLNDRAGVAQRVRWYQAALAVRPANAPAWNNLGLALRERNDPAGAAAAYAEAIRLAPDNAVAYANLANVRRATGDRAEAVRLYREAIRLDPAFPAPHNGLGQVFADRKDWDGAIENYRRALDIDPKNVAAWNNIGQALQGQGKPAEAVEAFARAVAILEAADPADPELAVLVTNLGNAHLDLKDRPRAEAAYRRAVGLDPEYAGAWNNLGNALRAQGRLDEAEAAYREAARWNPKEANALNGLGLVAEQRGDFDAAVRYFDAALKLDPGFGLARGNRAKVLKLRAERDRLAPPPRAVNR